MHARFLILTMSATALAAVALCPARSAQVVPQPDDTATPAPMVFPSWGFDVSALDRSVSPGDDFDKFVNGKWRAATPIPAKYSSYGVSQNLQILSEASVRRIVGEAIASNAATGTVEQRVADFYLAYLDQPAIERLGLEPAQPYLDQIASISNHADLFRIFAQPVFASAIGPGISIDRDDPSRYIAVFDFGGYGLPSRDNYLLDNPRNLEMRDKYREFLALMLARANPADSRARAEAVYALEQRIAANDWDQALARNPDLGDNYMTRAQLVALAPDLPIEDLIDQTGFTGVDRFLVPKLIPSQAKLDEQKVTPEQRAKIGGSLPAQIQLVRDTPLNVWKDWLTVRFLASNAPALPKDIDNAVFAFNSGYLRGTKTMPPRHERALTSLNNSIGEAVGRIYVERNFPATSKAAMINLVDNLRQAMALNIAEVKWMSPSTREGAERKLASLRVKIGYPDKFEAYDSLKISRASALENRLNVARWAHLDGMSKFRAPVDREQWFMTPQTVNAYYVPPLNEIVFPAAYLQAPNFSPSADPAVNYAAIGSTIGHEIGHGFDDNGARYDAEGRLRDWWTAQDKETFRKLSARLVSQYAAYCPFDNGKTCVDGQLTLGENIGDLAGLAIAYRAYKISLNGKQAPVIDGLTGDQRFFIAYAQKYRNARRDSSMRVILESDPHSPDSARVNEVLRNFTPWYTAFNIRPGNALYLAPSKRVTIW